MLRINWREKGNWIAFDSLFVFCIFSIYAGSVTPEVNESHYWVKASHFWNADFADRDMFVQSKDAHWFFFASIGALSNTFSLAVATWLGRILGWLSMSFAWCIFASRFSATRLAGSLSAGCWIAAMHSGHLSGEWIVGGCEAKVFAYAAAFIGLSCALDRSFGWGWIWMGIASAFHVLTGAWLVIATFLVFAFVPKGIRQQGIGGWVGLFLGGAISLLGLLPALALNAGVSPTLQDQGAIVYVFQRLPHHLVPTQFAIDRWLSYSTLLLISIAIIYCVRVRSKHAVNSSSEARIAPDEVLNNSNLSRSTDTEWLETSERYSKLITYGIVFSAIAATGLIIDLSLSSWATNWCASLLRYYWFRWNDVIWPTILSVSLLMLLDPRFRVSMIPRSGVVAALILPAVAVIGSQYMKHYRDTISPADQASLLLRQESAASRVQIHKDWLDMCSFIQSNTPADSLFLTPRFQQTFKWNAGRAEVVCWKDSPQDALGLIEWEKRLLKVFPRDGNGYGMEWSDKLLFELHAEYHFDYVLIDRRIQKTPPILEFIQSNATYALFRVIDLPDR